jgi:hypothetical protein
VLGFSFCRTHASLAFFDRSGALHTSLFDTDKNPLDFIRLLIGLSFATDTTIGYDPTIEETNNGQYIHFQGKSYQILNVEFISDMVRGRGIICFHVVFDDIEYAIKDVWADKKLKNEACFLKAAEGLPGIPVCYDEGIVLVEGRSDTTAWPRQCIQESYPYYEAAKSVEERVHRRIMMTPFGTPLLKFTSKIELLMALRDAITGRGYV